MIKTEFEHYPIGTEVWWYDHGIIKNAIIEDATMTLKYEGIYYDLWIENEFESSFERDINEDQVFLTKEEAEASL